MALNEDPELRVAGASRVQPVPANQTLTAGAMPRSWQRTFRPPLPENDPTNPAFTVLPTAGSVMHNSEAELYAAFDAARKSAEEVRNELDRTDDPILRGEWDVFKKITIQKGQIPSSILVSLGPPDVTVPGEWVDIGRRVLQAYRQKAIVEEPVMSPFDTNAGFPAMTVGFAAKLLSALLTMEKSADAIDELSRQFCSLVGLPEATAQSYGLNHRQGPLFKSQPYYRHVGGGTWDVSMVAEGAWPRARQVFMAAYGNTAVLLPLFKVLQSGRRGLLGLWHAGSSDRVAVENATNSRMFIYESDISGFDLTVSYSLQSTLCDLMTEAFPELGWAARIWLYYESRPVISPNRMLAPGYTLTTTRGATHSGQRLTAEVGTLITLITTLYVLKQLRPDHDPVTSWLRGDVMLLVQGDDVLIGTPEPLDIDEWTNRWRDVGLNCELLDARRFLSKHRVGSMAYPVAGRIVQQTLSNEHEPSAAMPLDWDPMLVLGLQSRWGVGPYPGLERLTEGPLKATALYERTGVFDGPTATQWLSRPKNKARLQVVLNKLASSPWMERLRRDAPYKASAQSMLDALILLGAKAQTEESISKNMILKRRMDYWSTRPRQERLELARRLWDGIQGAIAVTDEDAALISAA